MSRDRKERVPLVRPAGTEPPVLACSSAQLAPPAVAVSDSLLAQANVFAMPKPAAPAASGALDPAAILTSVGAIAYRWDIATDALDYAGNAADALGIKDPAALSSGRAFARLVDPATTITRFDAVMKSAQRDDGGGVPYRLQYALRPASDATPRWVEDVGRWFADGRGVPLRAQGVLRLINGRHAHDGQRSFLSSVDSLTGEMTRWRLTEALQATLDEAIRQRGSCGFLLVAIDNLARLNEAYGFDVADEVICAVARRLRAKMRGGDQLGRFSGNKFGLILNNCTAEDMEKAAERLLAGVRDDVVRTAEGPVAVTVTIGGVTAPRHARSVAELLNRAQETLDRAKVNRRGSFQIYRPNVEREANRKASMRAADEIVAALNERRILLAFEPVVACASRTKAFYECLMRIRSADGSLVDAREVIPVAERLGLVRLLDHRVLELLVSEMAAVPALTASINVSPASTADPDWWASLDALLRAQPTVGQRLIVEIRETAATHNLDDTRGFIARVKDLGCRIAIDDFGAGPTSFRSLRRLGVDILKIDGTLVQNMARSAYDCAIVRTLIDLARRLGLQTVAKWVQDEEAAKTLEAWGCDHLQGALIGLASIDRPWGTVVPVDRRKAART